MKRYAAIFLLVGVILSGLTISAFAVSRSVTVTVSWRILPFQSLTIAGEGGTGTSVVSHFNLRQPTAADLAAGYIEDDDALTLVAASNIPWTVQVHAIEPNMGRSNDGTYVKPLSDFLVRANNGRFFPIAQFDQPIASGGRGVYKLTLDYRVKLDPTSYRPGNYGLTLVYTITGK